jgi:hypothetical protein
MIRRDGWRGRGISEAGMLRVRRGVRAKRSVHHGVEFVGIAGLIPVGSEPKITGEGTSAFGVRRVGAPTEPPAREKYALAGGFVVPASGKLICAPSGEKPGPVSQSPGGPDEAGWPRSAMETKLGGPVGQLSGGPMGHA